MTLKLRLRLIRELGFVLAAYVLARIRFVIRRIASLSGADHRWVSVAALVVGVLAGVGGAQWTASEIPKTGEFAKASTSVGISNDPCLSGYHPHPLYVVCLLGLQARAGAGALRRRSG